MAKRRGNPNWGKPEPIGPIVPTITEVEQVVLVIVGVLRTRDRREGMLFQLLHHDLDSFVELRVFSLAECSRIQFDVVVRGRAMVFDFPVAVEAVKSGTGGGDASAVEEFGIAADSDQAAPSSLADQRTDACFTEIPGQRVAAR